jgi:hypothetical protein
MTDKLLTPSRTTRNAQPSVQGKRIAQQMMATVSTVGLLLQQHPVSLVRETGYRTQSNKGWLKDHPPVLRFELHTGRARGAIQANLDGPLEPLMVDDGFRFDTPAHPPNPRAWRFSSETDVANWFHHEVSNVVLAAFQRYPALLQVAEAGPLTHIQINERVDVMYTVGHGGSKQCVLVVEMKRNLIDSAYWMKVTKRDMEGQQKLGRELRGYVLCRGGVFLRGPSTSL